MTDQKKPLIGVLGGMGPLATVDFMQRVIELTPATRDQDHLALLVANLPGTPDRSAAIIDGGPSPLASLLDGIDLLNRNGVALIVVPCNSAHHWVAEMRVRSTAPMLHIGEACVDELPTGATRVAVLATGGTMVSGFYQKLLRERGLTPIEPDRNVQQHVSDCIREVKAGNIPASAAALSPAIRILAEQGAEAVIMGCTEIPLAARPLSSFAAELGVPLIDSTLALARATLAHARTNGWLAVSV